MRLALVAVIGLFASVAAAVPKPIVVSFGPPRRINIGVYVIEVADQGSTLLIRKAGKKAVLERVGGLGEMTGTFDVQAGKVSLTVEDSTCIGKTSYAWTFSHFEARLANDAALALHLKKDYAGAAKGFAEAAKHDPSWRLPAYNLASAQQLAGDHAAAVAALAPWLASEPLATYAQVTSDPELRPLLARPELRAIRAKQPGTARLTEKGLSAPILYSPDRNLIALVRDDYRWVAHYQDLEIYDGKTGALVATSVILRPVDVDMMAGGSKLTAAGKKAVGERIAKLDPMLAELGFVAATIEPGTTPEELDDRAKIYFPKAKLGVVAKADVANALRGNTQVGTVKSEGRPRKATYVQNASVVVLDTQRHSAEGCDGGPETGIYVMPVK